MSIENEPLNPEAIYLDFSTLAAFNTCHEKGRLMSVLSLRPRGSGVPALEFGSAYHAAVASLGIENDVTKAQIAFIESLKEQDSRMAMSIYDTEGPSIERGLALIEGYHQKWQNEHYETLVMDGKPMVEIKFRVWMFDFLLASIGRHVPVIFCGIIDRMARSRVSEQIVNIETKTTGQSLQIFVNNTRPNHQITGYHLAAGELLENGVSETVWDCIFKSKRKPDMKSSDYFKQRGVDIENDFARTTVNRTPEDIQEFRFDFIQTATEYLKWKESGFARWTRNAPTACSMYGGCWYKPICSTNAKKEVINGMYEVRKWEPWRSDSEVDKSLSG